MKKRNIQWGTEAARRKATKQCVIRLQQMYFVVRWRYSFTYNAVGMSDCFLPARHYASAGLCDSDVSVRLCVCLSVTRRYCA